MVLNEIELFVLNHIGAYFVMWKCLFVCVCVRVCVCLLMCVGELVLCTSMLRDFLDKIYKEE